MTDRNIKIGDKLAFRVGFRGERYAIHAVSDITPTGRIKCGPYTLNPNLTVRGRGDTWRSPSEGEIPDKTILESVKTHRLIDKFDSVKPKNLSLNQLERIVKIIKEND